ncbi:MAG TPA: hypothetical protein DDY78_06310 [Planctomycetales bacterium]|jgi:hypothetical protein|nr:hypothetical protein [Planctomycetales bacterium]
MARRTLNHKALRADFDAAERRKTEAMGEAGVAAAAAPTKKKAAASKTARPTRTRTTVRQRVVWGVFNNSNARVKTFPFPQKKEAEDYAAKLKAEKGSTFFVQPVKEPIEDR